LEDCRSLLEAAERGRKNAEVELNEVNIRISEITIQMTSLTNDKRRLEQDLAAMQSDLDDALNAQHAAEERAERLAAENHRLADELRQEQENYKKAESLRKQLEIEIREITVRLEEAEAFAQREGKRMVAKLQARLRDLEAELEAEQRRVRDAVANQRKAERFYKELMVTTEEERKQLVELQSINDTLVLRIKTYKRQVEEAEDVASLTLNKYRKAQALIDDAEARADLAEKNLSVVRRSRSMSVTREVVKVVKV
jgi:chromosome segregation ATPase